MSFNFDRYLSSLFRGNFLGRLLGFDVSNGIEGYFNKETGAGLTPADREAADLQLSNQQQLNEDDYQRKIDFYERFESPEAQVQQYKNAGLNPMLIAGNGSVSASGGVGTGSAASISPSSSSDFSGILSSILSFATRQQEVKNEYELGKRELDIRQSQADSLNNYYQSLTTGQNNENDVFGEVFGWRKRAAEDEHLFKTAEKNRLGQLLENDKVEYELKKKGIELADKDLAIKEFMKAQEKAKADNAGEYWRAIAEIQTATAMLQKGQADIFQQTWERQLVAARASLNKIIIDAGMQGKIFLGEAFKREVEGKMTSAEKWKTWLDFGGTVIGAATSLAVPYAAAAAGTFKGMTNISTLAVPRGGTFDPQQVQFPAYPTMQWR